MADIVSDGALNFTHCLFNSCQCWIWATHLV